MLEPNHVFIEKFSKSKLYKTLDLIRTGWNQYSFLFFIGAVVTIISGLLGLAYVVALPVTLYIFYYLGASHHIIERMPRN